MYVVSLHLQRGIAVSTLETAAIMAPLSLGIVATSFSLRDHVQRLGRRLVLAGSLLTLTGVLGLTVALYTLPEQPVAMSVPLFVAGLGMGCCFGSLFVTALGDVDESEAGSASGTLNALQQVANATGAALVSSMFVSLLAGHSDKVATAICLTAVAVILLLTAALTPLLPRHAVADQH